MSDQEKAKEEVKATPKKRTTRVKKKVEKEVRVINNCEIRSN